MPRRKWIWFLMAVAVAVLALVVYVPFWIEGRFDDLKAELEEEVRAFEARPLSRPPILGEAVPGTAWEHYAEAWALHERLVKANGRPAELDDWEGFDSPIPDALREHVLLLEPVLAAAARGADAAEAGRMRDVRLGIGAPDDVYWQPQLTLALRKLLRIRAVMLAREGRAAAAVDRLLVLCRFGEDMEIGAPAAIDYLVGAAVRVGAWGTAADLLGAGLLPAGERERLAERARDSLRRPWNGWDVLTGEALSMQSTLRILADGGALDDTRVGGVGRWFLYWAWAGYRSRLAELRSELPAGTPDDLRTAAGRAADENLGEKLSAGIAGLFAYETVFNIVADARDREVAAMEAFLLGKELVERGEVGSLDPARWEIRKDPDTGKREIRLVGSEEPEPLFRER